eukprot:NODE_267_length_11298_cov_1.167872.p3 type:complete len:477 gc:universal NODE_267_length_11298_cov_1.167872:5335-3905(-)
MNPNQPFDPNQNPNQQYSMPQSYVPDPSIQNSGFNTPTQLSQPTSTYSLSYQTQATQPSQQELNATQSQVNLAQESMQNMNLNRQQSELKDFYGPFLKFNGVLNRTWYGSVMIVSKRNVESLVLIDQQELVIQPISFTQHKEYFFLRFSFTIPLNQPRVVQYRINGHQDIFTVALPGSEESLRTLWHSCNGYSSGVDEVKYPFDGLWNHVLEQHKTKPYHCQMGGGDQLYCDKVFDEVPSLVAWIKIVSKKQRETHEWTQLMESETDAWFFQQYCRHFSRPGLNRAIAEIPYSFVLDDHDLFDGYGSYPDRLQNCPVFQGVFKVAYKYYLFFQHQGTEQMLRQEGYFGDQGNSFIRHLGDKQAVLLVDTRKERSKDQVVSPTSYRKIYDALDRLPVHVDHLFVLLPVPIVYPRLKATEKGLAMLSSAINGVGAVRAITKQFQKKGVFKAMISKFGEPECILVSYSIGRLVRPLDCP